MQPPDALGAALHEAYCHENRPMHSHPLHSADRILALIPTYSLTRSVDVERWQRIETAARLTVNAIDDKDEANIWGWSRALRDALGEG